MTFKMGWWFAKEYNPLQVGSIDGTDTIPHDHGIRRAIQAQQVARSDEDTFAVTPTDEKTASHTPTATNDTADPYKTIFVGKLDPITTTATLRSAFEAFGPLKDVKLVRCIVTGESKRYAFIEYMYERGCDNAYEKGHRMMLDGRPILVDYQRTGVMKHWIPRRQGGGFGGKKESGQLRFGCRDRPFREPIHQGQVTILPEQRYAEGWRSGRLVLPSDNRQASRKDRPGFRPRTKVASYDRVDRNDGRRHPSISQEEDDRTSYGEGRYGGGSGRHGDKVDAEWGHRDGDKYRDKKGGYWDDNDRDRRRRHHGEEDRDRKRRHRDDDDRDRRRRHQDEEDRDRKRRHRDEMDRDRWWGNQDEEDRDRLRRHRNEENRDGRRSRGDEDRDRKRRYRDSDDRDRRRKHQDEEDRDRKRTRR